MPTLARAEQVLTQPQIESRQVGQHAPGFGQFRRQAVEQLMLQVIEHDRRAPLLELAGTAAVTILQSHPHAGAPATAALEDPFAGIGAQRMG